MNNEWERDFGFNHSEQERADKYLKERDDYMEVA
jgi:hypothetical protein